MRASDFNIIDGKLMQKKLNPKCGLYEWEEALPIDLLHCANEEADRVDTLLANKEKIYQQYMEIKGYKDGVEAVIKIIKAMEDMRNDRL